jgi:hypothetical protein
MLNKTRTTIIALVAAFSFAGASLIPAVAQAMTKYEFVEKIAHKTNLTRRDPVKLEVFSPPPVPGTLSTTSTPLLAR